MSHQEEFTLGVEEEFLLVDAESRRLRPHAEEVLHDAGSELGDKGQLDQEFKRSQVEHGTAVCHTLEELS
ncbi:MAG: glutamate-cysteine ligase family protein, partial [Actinomycetota bacterium]|nr:glutamate-cysteine ligase family protein [Actinomycetota bacterium]